MGRPKKEVVKGAQLRVKNLEFNEVTLGVAAAIAEGKLTKGAIAKQWDISAQTISNWLQHPKFKSKVDEFILDCELAHRAGMLQLINKAVEQKMKLLTDDKSTALDWLKFHAAISGLNEADTIKEIKVTINSPKSAPIIVTDAEFEDDDDGGN